ARVCGSGRCEGVLQRTCPRIEIQSGTESAADREDNVAFGFGVPGSPRQGFLPAIVPAIRSNTVEDVTLGVLAIAQMFTIKRIERKARQIIRAEFRKSLGWRAVFDAESFNREG